MRALYEYVLCLSGASAPFYFAYYSGQISLTNDACYIAPFSLAVHASVNSVDRKYTIIVRVNAFYNCINLINLVLINNYLPSSV